ncbi:hypothetical protein EJ073_20490 [Mesorhizobium sp. M4B.F.Ca.ET.058.02.1.1]|nr:hypothetical protein EJ073_20490 [Mesorhizobium sp. M4B.F.Ca.ET.058.02.1.1]
MRLVGQLPEELLESCRNSFSYPAGSSRVF